MDSPLPPRMPYIHDPDDIPASLPAPQTWDCGHPSLDTSPAPDMQGSASPRICMQALFSGSPPGYQSRSQCLPCSRSRKRLLRPVLRLSELLLPARIFDTVHKYHTVPPSLCTSRFPGSAGIELRPSSAAYSLPAARPVPFEASPGQIPPVPF